MTDFKCAIFDLDGTLLDSMYVWKNVDEIFLSKRGIEVPKDYCMRIAPMGFRKAAEYTIARFSLNETADDLICEWNGIAAQEYEKHVRLKPNAEEYLLYLKAKQISLAIATSSHQALFGNALTRLGILPLFDAVCTSDQVARGKGFPDLYLFAARQLDMPACDCVVFEDILPGIIGAKAAGMRAFAVEEKASFQDKEEIMRLADKYIYDFSEMMV